MHFIHPSPEIPNTSSADVCSSLTVVVRLRCAPLRMTRARECSPKLGMLHRHKPIGSVASGAAGDAGGGAFAQMVYAPPTQTHLGGGGWFVWVRSIPTHFIHFSSFLPPQKPISSPCTKISPKILHSAQLIFYGFFVDKMLGV